MVIIKRLFVLLLILQTKYSFTAVCTEINFEGNYQFSSLEVAPIDPNDAIICVTASNVTIQLIGRLSQSIGNTVAGFDGIRIAPGLNNITIIGGQIGRLTGRGIVVGEGCDNIKIRNVDVNNCDNGGIVLAGTNVDNINHGSISDCIISSCNGAAGGIAYGLRLIESNNIEVFQCKFNSNDAGTANSGFGVSLELCDSCKLSDCEADSNGGNTLGAGISLYQSNWCTLSNCTVSNTISRNNIAGSKASGFLFDQCEHSAVIGCISQHNNNLLAEANGFEVLNGSDNIFNQCISQNNAGAVVATGFVFKGSETHSSIFKCKSRVNDGGIAGTGYGILLDGPQSNDIWYNQLIGNTGSSGYGLFDSVTDTTNLIVGNIAFENVTAGYQVTRTTGSFPLAIASVGDFSATATAGKYVNIAFTS